MTQEVPVGAHIDEEAKPHGPSVGRQCRGVGFTHCTSSLASVVNDKNECNDLGR